MQLNDQTEYYYRYARSEGSRIKEKKHKTTHHLGFYLELAMSLGVEFRLVHQPVYLPSLSPPPLSQGQASR
jgi:hypothetical protein